MTIFRRVLPLALVLLSLCGCGPLFDTEYYSSEPYQAPASPEPDGQAPAYDSIDSYAALLQAIMGLVEEHAASARLQFSGYEGSISQDISTACWEVRSSTALGAFAVDQISYDLSRIVSYYQAEVTITYKRTADQTEALERLDGGEDLEERLDRALRNDETYLVLELSDGDATADTIRAAVADAYYADPLACPVLPETDAALFPETGADRIAEISLDYGLEPEVLAHRRQELAAALQDLVAGLPEATPAPAATAAPKTTAAPVSTAAPDASPEAIARAERLRALCGELTERCRPDETAGSTAWDALVTGAADSEGMALALQAGCLALDLPCEIVAGRREDTPHFWNIVGLDGTHYHLDATTLTGRGQELFLAGDQRLLGDYWWDTSDHPACPEDFWPAEEEPQSEPTPAPEPTWAPPVLSL